MSSHILVENICLVASRLWLSGSTIAAAIISIFPIVYLSHSISKIPLNFSIPGAGMQRAGEVQCYIGRSYSVRFSV